LSTLYASKIYLLYVLEEKRAHRKEKTLPRPRRKQESARQFVRTNIPSEAVVRVVEVPGG
jgi:hypothetical protein